MTTMHCSWNKKAIMFIYMHIYIYIYIYIYFFYNHRTIAVTWFIHWSSTYFVIHIIESNSRKRLFLNDYHYY